MRAYASRHMLICKYRFVYSCTSEAGARRSWGLAGVLEELGGMCVERLREAIHDRDGDVSTAALDATDHRDVDLGRHGEPMLTPAAEIAKASHILADHCLDGRRSCSLGHGID